MTPQEKAKELLIKFNIDLNPMGEYGRWDRDIAIKNAITCINELIDCTHSEEIAIEGIGAIGYDKIKKYTYEYWEDVKQELLKLQYA